MGRVVKDSVVKDSGTCSYIDHSRVWACYSICSGEVTWTVWACYSICSGEVTWTFLQDRLGLCCCLGSRARQPLFSLKAGGEG